MELALTPFDWLAKTRIRHAKASIIAIPKRSGQSIHEGERVSKIPLSVSLRTETLRLHRRTDLVPGKGRLKSQAANLFLEQMGVRSATAQELGVAAGFNDVAVVDHDYQVGVYRATQAMGD